MPNLFYRKSKALNMVKVSREERRQLILGEEIASIYHFNELELFTWIIKTDTLGYAMLVLFERKSDNWKNRSSQWEEINAYRWECDVVFSPTPEECIKRISIYTPHFSCPEDKIDEYKKELLDKVAMYKHCPEPAKAWSDDLVSKQDAYPQRIEPTSIPNCVRILEQMFIDYPDQRLKDIVEYLNTITKE